MDERDLDFNFLFIIFIEEMFHEVGKKAMGDVHTTRAQKNGVALEIRLQFHPCYTDSKLSAQIFRI